MLLEGKATRSIIVKTQQSEIQILDQTLLPHNIKWLPLKTSAEVTHAIASMQLRGAPLIGACAGFGYFFALKESFKGDHFQKELADKELKLKNSRPTAVNLVWAVERIKAKIKNLAGAKEILDCAWEEAVLIVEEDIHACKSIGEHGVKIIDEIYKKKKNVVNILMHCNPGWLACLDWGTATAPIYRAQQLDIPVHVWVDETRPRNQGAKLTSLEFREQGIPCTIVCDNTGGHLMQHGLVDIVLVGSDRTTLAGDVANKIGTYLKALAARDNDVPLYVALPSSTFDLTITDAFKEIPIEERPEDEVLYMDGLIDGKTTVVHIAPKGVPALNYGFDVTPARLVTGLITERGICAADKGAILELFPEFSIPGT